ncbi:hypothetical protein SerAS12_0872 [Serratia sp. AS12]|nr:hypothetical protein SerAS9_0872 [Serratia plymuthica AS9]AEF48976.1 hypothetical protein SerAS12_0872 [Serratia sp. AS12]AEG26684.1 hypothetical protein SerAS13_0872 [Serratia sp. AS13]
MLLRHSEWPRVDNIDSGPFSFYPSSFKLQRCWLYLLTPVTHQSELMRIHEFAAWLQHEIHWVNPLLMPRKERSRAPATQSIRLFPKLN